MNAPLFGASPRTTDGAIALSNLEGYIDGLERSCSRGDLASQAWCELIDLVTKFGEEDMTRARHMSRLPFAWRPHIDDLEGTVR